MWPDFFFLLSFVSHSGNIHHQIDLYLKFILVQGNEFNRHLFVVQLQSAFFKISNKSLMFHKSQIDRNVFL